MKFLDCPGCGLRLLKFDRRRQNPMILQNKAELKDDGETAPRVKCAVCGKVVILLKGSLT